VSCFAVLTLIKLYLKSIHDFKDEALISLGLHSWIHYFSQVSWFPWYFECSGSMHCSWGALQHWGASGLHTRDLSLKQFMAQIHGSTTEI